MSWPNITRPDGVAWIEVGGTEKEMHDWLQAPVDTFPFKFKASCPASHAIGVKTMKGGEVVIAGLGYGRTDVDERSVFNGRPKESAA